jgi:deoxycytidylate deaminase
MAEVFPPQEFPELFFALVAPIGTEVDPSQRKLTEKLLSFGYTVIPIKVTDVFQALNGPLKLELETTPLEQRFKTHIAFGDTLRERFGDDSFLAYTCLQQIIFARDEAVKKLALKRPEKLAYILRQFKRKEEIDLLRSIYGRSLFQISIHSKRSSRVDNLSRKFASSHNSTAHNNYRDTAEKLVSTDEDESGHPHGQRISDVFHEADFIIDSNSDDRELERQIYRFADLVFGSNSLSPNKDEYGLYAAKSAALRTLDLSRQVGAAIFSERGEVIALGTNEVPKANGGTYWGDEQFDDRDFKRQEDSNERRKREIFTELINIVAPERRTEDLLALPEVRKSQFMDALEYGRMIHAEMSAICDAARLGRPLKGTTLYSTTFPCHMCAKSVTRKGD